MGLYGLHWDRLNGLHWDQMDGLSWYLKRDYVPRDYDAMQCILQDHWGSYPDAGLSGLIMDARDWMLWRRSWLIWESCDAADCICANRAWICG